MPYLKCVPCKIRFGTSAAVSPDPPYEACPSCGGPLEPVARFSELIGYRSFNIFAMPTVTSSPAGAGRSLTAERVAVAMARRDAAQARS